MAKKRKNKNRYQSKSNKQELHNNSHFSNGGVTNRGFHLTPGYHCADTRQNVWEFSGYPEKVTFDMYFTMSARDGFGKAGIHDIVNKCWQTHPIITDGEQKGKKDKSETPFEKDLKVLIKKHHLFVRLKGLDWRQRVGRYAGIIPSVRESKDIKPSDPLIGLNGIEAIIKLTPVFESQIDTQDVSTVSDFNDPAFGNPTHYNYRQNVQGDRNPIDNTEVQLDPSRVFVFAEGSDDGTIFGVPALEGGFNSLLNMEKIAGGSAEGLKKNASQRVVSDITQGQNGHILNDPDKQASFKQNAADFQKGIDSMLLTYGMDTKTLQSTLSDPTQPFSISLNNFAASISEPSAILAGQQSGIQASDKDNTEWNQTASGRCNNTLTDSLIIPFFEYLIEIGAMAPPTNEIVVTWPDFSEPNTKDKLAGGKTMAETNKLARDSGSSFAIYTNEEIRVSSGFEAEAEGELEEFEEDDDDDLPIEDS